MVTLKLCVMRRRDSTCVVAVGIGISIACAILACAHAARSLQPPQLYLLSGTPTEHTDKTFPMILYQVDAARKLKVVREVVPQRDGLRSAQVSRDTIFAIHPSIRSTSAAVIHMRDPLRQQDVVFASEGVFPNDAAVTASEPSTLTAIDLIPWITDASDPYRPKGTLASVSGEPGGSQPAVTFGRWDAYVSLRTEGSIGGPSITADLLCSTVGNNFAIRAYGNVTIIGELPSPLRDLHRQIVPIILAANEQHLLLIVQHTTQDMTTGKLGDDREAYDHDLLRGRWRTVRIDGNSSSSRLFGSWLATTVGMWNADHKTSPGRDSERNSGTDTRPDIRGMYAQFKGRWIWSPGRLVLQNLDDARKITIETGQEDSEVLWIGSETVLYRVNDTIYQARIVGAQVQNTTVLVKDEDVPEIHWIFWSSPR
jgi:hypothetical protein